MKSRQASAACDVDLGAGARLARAVDRLARAQQRLRRDAGPVRALAADQLPLHDGHPQPARGQRRRAVLARRPAAEDDHVDSRSRRQLRPGLLRDHVRGVPVGPVRVGLRRSASRARRARPPRAAARPPGPPTEAYDVSAASTRPGSRVVISCSSQVLPSGSAERGERAVAGRSGARPLTRPLVAGLELGARGPGMEHLADVGADVRPAGRARPRCRRRPGTGPGPSPARPRSSSCRTGPSSPSPAA